MKRELDTVLKIGGRESLVAERVWVAVKKRWKVVSV